MYGIPKSDTYGLVRIEHGSCIRTMYAYRPSIVALRYILARSARIVDAIRWDNKMLSWGLNGRIIDVGRSVSYRPKCSSCYDVKSQKPWINSGFSLFQKLMCGTECSGRLMQRMKQGDWGSLPYSPRMRRVNRNKRRYKCAAQHRLTSRGEATWRGKWSGANDWLS